MLDHWSLRGEADLIDSMVGRRETGERVLRGGGGRLKLDCKESVEEVRRWSVWRRIFGIPREDFCMIGSGAVTTMALFSSEIGVIDLPIDSVLEEAMLDEPI